MKEDLEDNERLERELDSSSKVEGGMVSFRFSRIILVRPEVEGIGSLLLGTLVDVEELTRTEERWEKLFGVRKCTRGGGEVEEYFRTSGRMMRCWIILICLFEEGGGVGFSSERCPSTSAFLS